MAIISVNYVKNILIMSEEIVMSNNRQNADFVKNRFKILKTIKNQHLLMFVEILIVKNYVLNFVKKSFHALILAMVLLMNSNAYHA